MYTYSIIAIYLYINYMLVLVYDTNEIIHVYA